MRCPQCKATVFRKEAERLFNVCPECAHHFYLPARERIAQLLDKDSFEEWFTDLRPCDPLGFKDRLPYAERLRVEQGKTGMPDAAVVGRGYMRGRAVVFGVTDFAFMAGSMGSVVGEKLTRAAEEATRLMLPLIIISGSGGGARMQEGILSLMQMPRATICVDMHREAGLPYVVVLTDPTFGGVSASYAMLGDIQIAEPGAQIGFTGARVIAQTIREKLPEGFQRAEYLHRHGMVDMVVHRKDLRATLAKLLEDPAEKLYVHHEEFGDRTLGMLAGYLLYAGIVDHGPQAISIIEKLSSRSLDASGREIVATTLAELV